jgi:hypothetical protein
MKTVRGWKVACVPNSSRLAVVVGDVELAPVAVAVHVGVAGAEQMLVRVRDQSRRDLVEHRTVALDLPQRYVGPEGLVVLRSLLGQVAPRCRTPVTRSASRYVSRRGSQSINMTVVPPARGGAVRGGRCASMLAVWPAAAQVATR